MHGGRPLNDANDARETRPRYEVEVWGYYPEGHEKNTDGSEPFHSIYFKWFDDLSKARAWAAEEKAGTPNFNNADIGELVVDAEGASVRPIETLEKDL